MALQAMRRTHDRDFGASPVPHILLFVKKNIHYFLLCKSKYKNTQYVTHLKATSVPRGFFPERLA